MLKMSLAQFSRSEIESRLGESHRLWSRVSWAAEFDDSLILTAAIWRRAFSVGLLTLAILQADTNHADSAIVIEMPRLLITIAAVLVWLYVSEIGVAFAVAEHSASGVVKGALWFLPVIHTISRPFTIPLLTLNEVIRRLIGAPLRDDLEEDIRQVVEESEREGTIGETEREMFEAIVDFRTATADEVMTPRIDIEAIDRDSTMEEIKHFIVDKGHSRFPVFDETVDKIVGILYVKDLLPFLGQNAETIDLESILRHVPFIPESRRISDLLVEFQQQKTQLAIVLDEYGGTAGLITIEDIVEEVVGEIRDEHEKGDDPEPSMEIAGEGVFIVDARFHIDDLNDEAGTTLPEDADFDTVGGWVFSSIGRIPSRGEKLDIDDLDVEILASERTHITKVRISLRGGRDNPTAAKGTIAHQNNS